MILQRKQIQKKVEELCAFLKIIKYIGSVFFFVFYVIFSYILQLTVVYRLLGNNTIIDNVIL